jgi:succinoglycan biosynthesis protein ExoM
VTTRHVTVCVCTFKRPALLRRALEGILQQRTDGTLTFGVVVVDNDVNESARAVVDELASRAAIPITYRVEPRQNISLARNRALADTPGDFVALIDDDESPAPEWLLALVRTCDTYRADGVLGPVYPEFEAPPAQWITRGRFCERPNHETGDVMPWRQTRTGNVLLTRAVVDRTPEPFDPQFGTGGEDVDFFRRMMRDGCQFVWCREAAVYEIVSRHRTTRRYMLARALLRGRITLKLPGQVQHLTTSVVAVPIYVALLPLALLKGQHVFMKYAISLCDHLGRLLDVVGLNPIDGRDVQ